jgi:hypothetical protein
MIFFSLRFPEFPSPAKFGGVGRISQTHFHGRFQKNGVLRTLE